MRSRRLHPSSSQRARCRRSGISLIFVLCALVVLGIAAVFAIPAYFDRPEITLDNACQLVSHDVRALQNRAALDKVGVRVVLERDGWRALTTEGAPIAGINDDLPIDRHFTRDGVFGGVTIENVEAGPDHALGINPHGLVLEHVQFDLVFKGERRHVKVFRGAGDVVVEATQR